MTIPTAPPPPPPPPLWVWYEVRIMLVLSKPDVMAFGYRCYRQWRWYWQTTCHENFWVHVRE